MSHARTSPAPKCVARTFGGYGGRAIYCFRLHRSFSGIGYVEYQAFRRSLGSCRRCTSPLPSAASRNSFVRRSLSPAASASTAIAAIVLGRAATNVSTKLASSHCVFGSPVSAAFRRRPSASFVGSSSGSTCHTGNVHRRHTGFTGGNDRTAASSTTTFSSSR